MVRQRKKTKILINSILSVLAVIWIFPVIFTILGALKGKQEYNLGNIWDLPKGFLLFENLGYLSKGADITIKNQKGLLASDILSLTLQNTAPKKRKNIKKELQKILCMLKKTTNSIS